MLSVQLIKLKDGSDESDIILFSKICLANMDHVARQSCGIGLLRLIRMSCKMIGSQKKINRVMSK
jgi:hypothetical protein